MCTSYAVDCFAILGGGLEVNGRIVLCKCLCKVEGLKVKRGHDIFLKTCLLYMPLSDPERRQTPFLHALVD